MTDGLRSDTGKGAKESEFGRTDIIKSGNEFFLNSALPEIQKKAYVLNEAERVSKTLRNKREQVRFSINKIIAEMKKAKKKSESYREYLHL
jgi:hypothetical protein